MPGAPYRPARINIAIPKPSYDNQYWGRYPQGDKPGGLNASAAMAAAAAAALSTGIPFAGSAAVASSSSAGLTTGGGGIPTPANVTITRQGTNRTDLSWSAVSGASGYKVYRNGTLIGSPSLASYSDTTAANTQIVTLDAPATKYAYTVSAIVGGAEGPQSTNRQVFLYRGSTGGSTCGNSDFSYGISENYADTTGSPPSGLCFKAGYTPRTGGGWQPYSNSPLVDTIYCLDVNQFTRFSFDVEMDSVNFMYIAFYSRLPFGDIYTWAGQDVHLSDYITAVAGHWATVDMAMADTNMGECNCTASIGAPYGTLSFNGGADIYPYATMTVTSKDSAGANIDAGGFILGSGLSGSVWVGDFGQHSTVGTFKVIGPGIGPKSGSTSVVVSSRSMTYQRYNAYKLNFGMPDGQPGGAVRCDNVRFYHP